MKYLAHLYGLVCMNKNLVITLIAIIALSSLLVFYFSSKTPMKETLTPEDSAIVYKNTKYGFNFSLPDNWEGYIVVQNSWEGVGVTGDVVETGLKFLIRNPKWTEAVPYEDLPIMVFTKSQWVAYENEEFAVSAAPIPATELATNNLYVFALPPRWDFDYSLDYKEAQEIMAGRPLQTFNVVTSTSVGAKLDINFVCEQALSYMTFTDGAAADQFVAECKEGEHLEVIKKYIADQNLSEGAAI